MLTGGARRRGQGQGARRRRGRQGQRSVAARGSVGGAAVGTDAVVVFCFLCMWVGWLHRRMGSRQDRCACPQARMRR